MTSGMLAPLPRFGSRSVDGRPGNGWFFFGIVRVGIVRVELAAVSLSVATKKECRLWAWPQLDENQFMGFPCCLSSAAPHCFSGSSGGPFVVRSLCLRHALSPTELV